MRRLAVTTVGLSVLIAGCASPAATLEGTWRTGTLTESDIEATLQEAGLEEWIEPLRGAIPAADPPTSSQVFTLDIHDGQWNLYWQCCPDFDSPQPLDTDAEYTLEGDTVVVSNGGDSNTYRWSVDGDTLTITWLETTYGDHAGIPEEVFNTAYYMSSDFQRQE